MTTYVRPRVWLTYLITSLILCLVSSNRVFSQNLQLNLNEEGQALLDLNQFSNCFEPQLVCVPSKAEGDGHAVWLSNNPTAGSTTDFLFNSGVEFVQNADGTATLLGTMYNTSNPNDTWEVKLYLDNKRNWDDWSGLGRSYKDENGYANANFEDWSYYEMDLSQSSVLIGTGDNLGQTLTMLHMPANYNYGFQVGTAANNKNSAYGMSGWFSYSWDGVNYHQGDFNVDLNDCSENTYGYTLSASQETFDCDDLGAKTIVLTSSDGNGNTCTQEVTIEINDNIAPTLVVQERITILLNANGSKSITPDDVIIWDCASGGISVPEPTPGSDNSPFNIFGTCTYDNCAIVTTELDKPDFDCTDVGENTVTVTVTDAAGNSTFAQVIVEVYDQSAPIVEAIETLTVELGADGNITITPEMINQSPVDNCGELIFTVNPPNFDCEDVGNTFPVTLTGTDANGNTSSDVTNVTIVDNAAPIVITQNISVSLDAEGSATIEALDLLSICNDAIIDLAPVRPPRTPRGRTPEVPGALSAGSFEDFASLFTIDAVNGEGCTADNCKITQIVASQLSFDCSHIGENTVTLTVTDNQGNSTVATAIVTIEDDIAPTLVAQERITILLNANGSKSITPDDVIIWDCASGGISVPEPTPGSDNSPFNIFGTCTYDNCAIVTTELDKPDFDCTDVGENTVTVTVTDAAGNSTSAQVIVEVYDQSAPIVDAVETLTVELGTDGNITITPEMINQSPIDACGELTFTVNPPNFDCEDVGNTFPVTLTGTDANGNTSSDVTNVTIVDNAAPEVVTQNITLPLDASGNVTIEALDLLVICDDAVIDLAPVRPPRGPRGRTPEVPGALSADSFEDFASLFTIDAVNGEGCTADNCKITQIVASQLSFDCSHIGENTITLTVTDNQGNSTIATAVVTIEDITPPTVVVQDVSLSLNASGEAVLSVAQAEVSSSDNCGVDTKALSKTNFNCDDLGTQTVSLTVTDVNGLATTEIFQVTVTDDTPPVIITQNTTVYLDENGQASITTNDINNGSFDNCSLTLSASQLDFDCSQVGDQTVLLTGTDGSGNTSSATATVTVIDNIAPSILAQNIQVSLDQEGQVTITAGDLDTGSYDNCGVPNLVIDMDTFTCDNAGDNTVTITATDASGNTTTQTVTVNVVDDIAPTVLTQNTTVFLDENGQASITVNDIDNGSFDNCQITLTSDPLTFDCSNLGDNIVTLTGTDNSGNTTSATAIVTVIDDIIPTASSSDLTIHLDENGMAVITADQVNNGSTDNCGTPEVSINMSEFDCSDLGENTIILTVTDASGNVATSISTITVIDEISPVFTTTLEDITTQIEGNTCDAIITWNEPQAIDNCDSYTITSNYNSGDTFSVGTTEVIYTVIDASGNSTDQSFNVEVIAAPINIEVSLSTYGSVGNFNVSCEGALDGAIDIVATGGCGDYTFNWSNGATTEDISNLSSGTYTLTVTDANGNSATESFELIAPDPLTVGTYMSPQNPAGQGTDEHTIYLGYGAQSATLTAIAEGGSGNYTYQWSPSDDIDCVNDNSITVAPQITTTYDVLVTDELGCTTSQSFTIEVIDVRCEIPTEPCECNGKMQNFTVIYLGESGKDINVYKKDKKKLITTFSNVQKYDELTINGFGSKGQLDSKTFLKVDGQFTEIHTSCSIDIIGNTYGPFMVVEYTDGEGNTCDNISSPPNDDKDDDKGGKDEFECDCDGKMQNFTVQYLGLSGLDVEVYGKYKDYAYGTFSNVQYLQEFIVDFDIKGSTLDSKTFLKVGGEYYEIHTSCSVDILGETFGPFKVIAYTDGAGNSCSTNGNDGGIDGPVGDNGGNSSYAVCNLAESNSTDVTADYLAAYGNNSVVDNEVEVGEIRNGNNKHTVFFYLKNGTSEELTFSLELDNTGNTVDLVVSANSVLGVRGAEDDPEVKIKDIQLSKGEIDHSDIHIRNDGDCGDGGITFEDKTKKYESGSYNSGPIADEGGKKKKGKGDFQCNCEGKMQNFTVQYLGLSGVNIFAYDKRQEEIIANFNDVQYLDVFTVNGKWNPSQLDSKTFLKLGNQFTEIHTSCSIDILGQTYGLFKVIAYTDGEGTSCQIDGNAANTIGDSQNINGGRARTFDFIDTSQFNTTSTSSNLKTSCEVTTPQNGAHALWLSYYSQGQHARYHFVNGSGELIKHSDGTASVTGLLENDNNPLDQWEIDFKLENKMNWAEWSALGRSYKDENGYAGSQYLSWSYYELAGQSKLIGSGINAGIEKPVSHMPNNKYYGFQLGTAANNKNGNYGISGWFTYENQYGEVYQGDINMDISNCMVSNDDNTGGCDLNITEWTGGVSMCLNGRAICVAADKVNDFRAMGASLGNCQFGLIANNGSNERAGETGDNEESGTTPTEASDMDIIELTAFPNPTQGKTKIKIISSESAALRIGVFNTSGVQIGYVFEGKVEGGQVYEFEYDGTLLLNGVYMIRANIGGTVRVKKLLIRH